MPAISTGLALAIGLGAAGAGTAVSAIGASKAAGAQAGAARSAAGLQFQLGEDQLKQNQAQFDVTQKNLAPWLQAGTQGIGSLAQLLGTPGQGLLTPWTSTFQAPTAEQARQTPGYQFAQQQGQNAIQNSAAAQGGLLSTGAMKTLDQYSQGLADQTYQQTYSRALGEYQQAYNIFQGNQSNTFNRLAALSGIGQTTATSLGQLSQQASNTGANITANIGSQVGNSLLNIGGAQASGYAGIANAINGGLGSISQYALLSSLLNPARAGATATAGYDPYAGAGV